MEEYRYYRDRATERDMNRNEWMWKENVEGKGVFLQFQFKIWCVAVCESQLVSKWLDCVARSTTWENETKNYATKLSKMLAKKKLLLLAAAAGWLTGDVEIKLTSNEFLLLYYLRICPRENIKIHTFTSSALLDG